jgi:hypothetical protein
MPLSPKIGRGSQRIIKFFDFVMTSFRGKTVFSKTKIIFEFPDLLPLKLAIFNKAERYVSD